MLPRQRSKTVQRTGSMCDLPLLRAVVEQWDPAAGARAGILAAARGLLTVAAEPDRLFRSMKTSFNTPRSPNRWPHRAGLALRLIAQRR
jgi:hypothetical protein